MRCVYCGVEVTNYPANGICTCCGGKLPAQPEGTRCPSCGAYSSGNFCSACGRSLTGRAAPVQPVYAPVQPIYVQPVYTQPVSPAMICPKCRRTQVTTTTRGFSWGLAMLGFFLLPAFGLLLGFCGSKKPCYRCAACGKKWKAV